MTTRVESGGSGRSRVSSGYRISTPSGCAVVPPARHQLEIGLHVAVQGPADVGERVIVALDLVGGIVPARPVGRAHQQIDLLPIEHVALDLQPDVADDDDRAL